MARSAEEFWTWHLNCPLQWGNETLINHAKTCQKMCKNSIWALGFPVCSSQPSLSSEVVAVAASIGFAAGAHGKGGFFQRNKGSWWVVFSPAKSIRMGIALSRGIYVAMSWPAELRFQIDPSWCFTCGYIVPIDFLSLYHWFISIMNLRIILRESLDPWITFVHEQYLWIYESIRASRVCTWEVPPQLSSLSASSGFGRPDTPRCRFFMGHQQNAMVQTPSSNQSWTCHPMERAFSGWRENHNWIEFPNQLMMTTGLMVIINHNWMVIHPPIITNFRKIIRWWDIFCLTNSINLWGPWYHRLRCRPNAALLLVTKT